MSKILHLTLKYRYFVLSFILALTVIAAIYFLQNFGKADNSLPVWFEKEDPDFNRYQEFKKSFGEDQFIYLAFEIKRPNVVSDVLELLALGVSTITGAEYSFLLEDALSPNNLQWIHDVTTELSRISSIEKVTSLTNMELIDQNDTSLIVQPFIKEIPSNQEQAKQIKEKILSRFESVRHLVSKDLALVSFILQLSDKQDESLERVRQNILDIISKKNTSHYPYHLSGTPITEEAFNRLVVRDQHLFFPMSVFLTIVILALFFRRIFLIIIPSALLAVLLFWMLALFYFAGFKLNVVTGMVCPILLAVCVANSVHVMLEYYDQRSSGNLKKPSLLKATSIVARPAFYTALTTLTGFISFGSSAIPPITHLGIFSAIGVILSLGLTLLFLPALLFLLPETPRFLYSHPKNSLSEKILDWANRSIHQYARCIICIFILAGSISFWGITQLNIETNFNDYFFKKEKVRQDLEFFDRHFGGVTSTEIVFTAQESLLGNIAVLKKIESFENWVERHPITTYVNSPLKIFKSLNQSLHEGQKSFFTLPEDPLQISELYFVSQASLVSSMERLISPDEKKIHLSIKSRWQDNQTMSHYLNEIRSKLEELFLPLHFSLTGYGPLLIQLQHHLLKSQILSILISFLVITLMMSFFLKSLKLGLISMIPNVLPILFTMGFMGFVGIPLNVATIMIAAVSLGITVDDTIHYLSRFRLFFNQSGSYEKAISQTNHTIGRAIIFTSIILFAGFGMLTLGSFRPSVYFGSMVGLTLLFAIVCEIFLTPLLLLWIKPYKTQSKVSA